MTQSENISLSHSGSISSYSNIDEKTQNIGSVLNCLHRIAIRLNQLNITLQLLDQDLVLYRRSVKSGIYKNSIEHIFKEKVFELKQIQKELKVYHLYNRFTLKVLCQDYCIHHDHIYMKNDDDDEQESTKSVEQQRSRPTFI